MYHENLRIINVSKIIIFFFFSFLRSYDLNERLYSFGSIMCINLTSAFLNTLIFFLRVYVCVCVCSAWVYIYIFLIKYFKQIQSYICKLPFFQFLLFACSFDTNFIIVNQFLRDSLPFFFNRIRSSCKKR